MFHVQQHDNIKCCLEIQEETDATHDDNTKCVVITSHKERSSTAFVITSDNGLFAIIDQFVGSREIFASDRGE